MTSAPAPDWLELRIQRVKLRRPELAPQLEAVRPIAVQLVLAQAASYADLIARRGFLGEQLALESRPGLYAISTHHASPGEFVHVGQALGPRTPILSRLKTHLTGWASNQGGRLMWYLKCDGWADEASARQWIDRECVVRWLCLEPDEVRTEEDFVIGLLNHRYGRKPTWAGT